MQGLQDTGPHETIMLSAFTFRVRIVTRQTKLQSSANYKIYSGIYEDFEDQSSG